jgi:hypothetical protein
LNALLASILLLLTVLVSLSLGVLTSYAALHAVLYVFSSRSRREPRPALMARAHAAGD